MLATLRFWQGWVSFRLAFRNSNHSKGLSSFAARVNSWTWHQAQGADDVAAQDPIVSGVAGRYATALFELARDEKALDVVKADLDRFEALIAESDDLKRLIRSPVFSSEDQLKAMTAVLAQTGIGGIAANFVRFAAQNRRLFAVPEMIRSFRLLLARHRGESSADVTVAEKLSDAHLGALKEALKSVTGGQDVDLNVKVDPAIIGGLVVKLGSRMVDTSLRTKLNAIKFAMKEAR
jgi:F-type H+-transporting ATPase subunit delta